MTTEPQLIILFDGICNLCNSIANVVIDHDKKARIKFAALQSEPGKKILRTRGFKPEHNSSVVFIEGENAFTESTAAGRIARHLDGIWKLGALILLLPPFLRNALYRLIARNRYRWFGKRETCRVPTENLRDRFL